MIDPLRHDLRYAIRPCLRVPGFALLAILTVAVGVGANAAIFSVVNAMLLRALPFPRDGELVLVSVSNRQTRQSSNNAMPAIFLDWRARNHSFTGLARFREGNITLSSPDPPPPPLPPLLNPH